MTNPKDPTATAAGDMSDQDALIFTCKEKGLYGVKIPGHSYFKVFLVPGDSLYLKVEKLDDYAAQLI